MQNVHTNRSPARKPARMRPIFPAPKFWAEKLEMPLPRVVSDVMTRLFSLTAAEYPAITAEPKELITPWMMMLPTEIKLCCKILGTATTEIFPNSFQENSLGFSSVSILSKRLNTKIMARMQLTPWHKKVAHATPSTPRVNTVDSAVVNRMSMPILATEDTARK